MTARILRIELRRSAAVWAALVSLPFVLSYGWARQTPRICVTRVHRLTLDGLRESGREALSSLLMGAGTHPCGNAPPGPGLERSRYETARLVAAAWLLDEEPLAPTHLPTWWGGLPDQAMTLPAYQALRALPADQQRARVAALREAELACDQRDRLDILTGPGDPA